MRSGRWSLMGSTATETNLRRQILMLTILVYLLILAAISTVADARSTKIRHIGKFTRTTAHRTAASTSKAEMTDRKINGTTPLSGIARMLYGMATMFPFHTYNASLRFSVALSSAVCAGIVLCALAPTMWMGLRFAMRRQFKEYLL